MKWKIWISGYGTYYFEGAEDEAEKSMRDKMHWERANGLKWRADLSRRSDKLTEKIVGLWEAGKGVPRPILLARKKAIDIESSSNT